MPIVAASVADWLLTERVLYANTAQVTVEMLTQTRYHGRALADSDWVVSLRLAGSLQTRRALRKIMPKIRQKKTADRLCATPESLAEISDGHQVDSVPCAQRPRYLCH